MIDAAPAAWTAAKHAELSRSLRELDELRDKILDLHRKLEAVGLRHRNHATLTCDRCRATLALTSSLAADLGIYNASLRDAALKIGWRLSAATSLRMGVEAPGLGDRDLCRSCSSLA